MVVDRKTEKIICIHQTKGKVDDFKLFKRSKLALNKNKKLKADLGYQGIEKIHTNSQLPQKSSKCKPLSSREKKRNIQLSRRRVKVEHVIGRIKIFKIIAERYRNIRQRHELRMKLICGIYNFERS